MSRRRKAAMMALFTAIFGTVAVVVPVVILANGGPWSAAVFVLVVVGVVALLAGIGLVVFLRQTDDHDDMDFVPVPPPSGPAPPPVPKGGEPWPLPAVAAALAEAFDGTPYVVLAAPGRIRVHADVVDARWQHLATERALSSSVVVTLSEKAPGVLRRNDAAHRVETVAGVPQIGAQVAVQSGRTWSYQRRVEYGVGLDGFRKRVDYEFSTSELNAPIKAVLGASGWRTAMDAETRTALIIGALGASSIIVVPAVFLVRWLMER